VTEPADNEAFTLLVEVGRKLDDGLPDGCDGAALLCFVGARSEDEAVRAAVETLKAAGMAPLNVDSYGTEAERLEAGHQIDPDHQVLMARAREEDAVIVAQMVPFEDDEEDGDDD